MNRFLAPCACLALGLPTLAAAGEIYGTVSGDSGPVAEGTLVEASCKVGKHGPVKTDKAGKYRLVVSETGKCALTVTRGAESASASVVSFDDSAQVDLVLKADENGKLVLRRR